MTVDELSIAHSAALPEEHRDFVGTALRDALAGLTHA